jgi:hypothetical protein
VPFWDRGEAYRIIRMISVQYVEAKTRKSHGKIGLWIWGQKSPKQLLQRGSKGGENNQTTIRGKEP